MKNTEEKIKALEIRLNKLDNLRQQVLNKIEYIQKQCEHLDVKTWTSTDVMESDLYWFCNQCKLRKVNGKIQ